MSDDVAPPNLSGVVESNAEQRESTASLQVPLLIQVMEKLAVDIARNLSLKKEIDLVLATGTLTLAISDAGSRIQALNAVQKLIAHNILVGASQGDPTYLDDYATLEQDLSFALDVDHAQEPFHLIDEIILLAAQVAFKQDDVTSVQLQVIKLFLTIVTAEALQVHSISLLNILKVCFLIHSASSLKSTNELTSKASLTQMINLIFSRMERFASLHSSELGIVSDSPQDSAMETPDVAGGPAHPDTADAQALPAEGLSPGSPTLAIQFECLKKDVRMTLRFLCMFGLAVDGGNVVSPSFNSAEVSDVKALDELSVASIKNRSLALELILSVFQNLGPAFLQDNVFFGIVKKNVSLLISRNAITTNPLLFELSLSIFLLLIRFYRHKLKLEVEIQLGMYLQILEMGNSTYKQKSNILQGLLKICENPQTLLDIYLNYDCEFEMSSIYEKLISICSRIVQGRGESASFAAKNNSATLSSVFGDSKQDLIKQQDRRLHLRALCILTAIIQSLVSWSQDSESSAALSHADSVPDEEGLEVNPVVGKNPLLTNPSNLPGANASNETGESENDKAEQVTSKKQIFRRAVKLFSSSPKKGMKAFIAGGFVEELPEAIAAFLKNTAELSKASIGDYIGEGDAFNIKVMHSFINSMDFAGYDFVAALRHFLQAFRLPGEAQKIDRMMEKFADRYCEQNPAIFAKADTAYTLAFSVIMLNTDQHSSQIKHRMNKAAFLKNNRGINDDGDLPDEFLGAIFDEISTNEIIMEDERSDKLMKITLGWGAGEANEKQRREVFKQELSLIQKKTQLLMTGAANRVIAPFRVATNRELTRTMFSTCSWAFMAALSISFEGAPEESGTAKTGKEPLVVDLCLTGLTGAIRLACLFRLETERDAFVSSLAKLTSLSNFYDIRPKNIKAIGALIGVASSLGEYLETGWTEIMKSLSLLEKMQVIVRGEEGKSPRKSSIDDGRTPDLAPPKEPQHISKILQKYAEEVQSQNFLIAIDRIFTNSVKLSAPAIISYFKSVCQVSLDEVGLNAAGELASNFNSSPRMYLLQKIVEIAHYNMHRIRFEWTQIWRILQPHFNKVACHPNTEVASFAIDSLRQLGVKFLEREELGQFSSQHEFLKSFEWIIKQNHSPALRELILNSLSQMITARASRIRSGWKSIFVTLSKAAQTDEKLAKSSFQIIQVVFRKHFEDVVAAGGFVDLVACLAEYALLPGSGPLHDELVMSSIQMLQSCTKSLIERAAEEESGSTRAPAAKPSAHPSAISIAQPHAHIPRINNLPQQPYLINGYISEEHFYLSWFPILTSFSRVINESEGVLVRTHTIEILFETLRSTGTLFAAPYWKTISRNIISPIFEELKDPEINSGRETGSAVMILGLRLLGQLITTHFQHLTDLASDPDHSAVEFLYSSVDLMVDMMIMTDDKLASTGQTCFAQFLSSSADRFTADSWGWIMERIERGFRSTLPAELIRCQNSNPAEISLPPKIVEAALEASAHIPQLSLDSLDFDKTIIKCITHLEFLSTIKEFCFNQLPSGGHVIASMPREIRARLLQTVYASYVVARMFNSLTSLRHAIYKRGWVAQLPNLVKQETTSLSAYLTLLFASCKVGGEDDSLEILSAEVVELFTRFTKLLADSGKSQRDIVSWGPIVVVALKELCDAEALWGANGPMRSHIPQIYKLTVKMIGADRYLERPDLRIALIDFLDRVGSVYFG
ncbi:Brefeldin A-inhibited guanine nucleotide-exchange protein 1 [Kappamyces sp. JEL0829]|nr:Brefeldin A-inhibited guanine nucleotide-exchange protein 1 [Kappamyces sp. JEL0829]